MTDQITSDDAIYWPNFLHSNFQDSVDAAISSDRKIVISATSLVRLSAPIHVKSNGSCLRIIGLRSSSQCAAIDGEGHSIFIIGGRNCRLIIENLIMVHSCSSEQKELVGGAVYARHQSKVEIYSCTIKSVRGFCIWGVQNCSISAFDSVLESVKRSGCVLFGNASLRLNNSIV